MKRLTTTMCVVLLTLYAATSYSQTKQINKVALFEKLPTTINCTEHQLKSMFTVAKGQGVKLSLGDDLSLQGPVISNQLKYSNLQTIVIKLTAFKDALFSLSKQTDAQQNVHYVGRIMNPQYTDGFELTRNADGNYQLIKIDLDKIFVDCNQ
jgi:uncharacterized LabA/DUF88 family protein